MDPERLPVLPQSKITPPVADSLGEEVPGPTIPGDLSSSTNPQATATVDTSNWVPYAGNVYSRIPSSEKEKEFIQSPLPVHLRESNAEKRESNPYPTTRIQTGIDWIVPTEDGDSEPDHKRTVGERLQPTLDVAMTERDKYIAKAKWTGYALNVAIGLQVLLGALTTGLSAAAVTGGKSTAAATTALGALATLVASYLAQARGSNEPDLSIKRSKDLEQFIRECLAFQLDHGHLHGCEYDSHITGFRRRFEEILGNTNGDKKAPPPTAA